MCVTQPALCWMIALVISYILVAIAWAGRKPPLRPGRCRPR